MRIDVLARRWGGPNGGPDGMAIAASFLAWTLCQLGHQVRGYTQGATPWLHGRMDWRRRTSLHAPDDFTADLVVSTVHPTWRRTAAAAQAVGASGRVVYWHHHGGLPPGFGCLLAAPPAIDLVGDWARAIHLPPSSWAAEAGGHCIGDAVLVPGAGPAKGGHVALAVARLLPEARFYVLPGRCSAADLAPWRALQNAEVAPGQVAPEAFLARARAVLSPTRFEVHPLTLVEAAARGIPTVCTSLPSTYAAAGKTATYLPMNAPTEDWAEAVRQALVAPCRPLRQRPYSQVVAEVVERLVEPRRAVA